MTRANLSVMQADAIVIFPAPITANRASENWICKSGTDFISLNSTAALDTDTEP